jgi:hypothetical protein
MANMGAVTLALENGQLSVSWQAVSGAANYQVYYNTADSIPGSPAQTVSGTSVILSNLTAGTTCYVWVKPVNGSSAGGVSAVVSIIILGTPGAPTLTAGDRQLEASWAAVPGAAEYEVFYGTGSANTLFVTTSQTTATITGLINGVTYTVRLRAKNSDGTSAYGEIQTGIPHIAGLYRGTTFATAEKIGLLNLSDSLAYISANVLDGDNFYIVLVNAESIAPKTLGYNNKTVGITLMSSSGEQTVQLMSAGSLFTIQSGVTLTLESNVTLKGRANNTNTLVRINSGKLIMNGGTITGNTTDHWGGGVFVGGTFIMNGGTINGNTTTTPDNGGGVYVMTNGMFTMQGGTISGNTVSSLTAGGSRSGGGVYVSDGGTFTKTSGGGVVYGSNAAETLKNNGTGAAVYREYGGKKRNTTIPASEAFDSSSSSGWD